MRFVRTAESIFDIQSNFTRVEYLQSTGTQYIDTGFVPTSDNFKYEGNMQASVGWFFGYRSVSTGTTTGDMRAMFVYPDGRMAIRYGAASNNSTLKIDSNKVYKIFFDGTSIYVNDVNFVSVTEKYNDPDYKSMYLFSANATGYYSSDMTMLNGKIYNWKIWDNDTLVRDFIPCIDPLGRPCMYDLVGKKAYYNEGTGEFTVGRQIIPVEYLESTGVEYIDTGYKPVPATTKFEFYFSPTNISGNYFPFGARPNTSIGGETCTTYFSTGNIRQDWAGLNTYFPKINVGDKVLYTAYNNTVSLNDNSVTGTVVRSTNRLDYNFLLFTVNTAGTADSRRYIGRVYYSRLWDNGVLVRDFIPCKDENNVGFMFDTLSGIVYLNEGTGTFSVGENKYTSKLRLIKDAKELPDGYKRVEYLQSDGNQYIDTEYTINTATDEVLFNFQMISTTLYQWIMGEHDDGARFGVGVGDGTNKRNIAYGSTTYKVNDTEIYNSIHYFVANSNGVYLNGTQVHGFETFSSSSTVYLFKLNLSGSNGAAGKIWRYVQKRNGVLIRDMIPCLDENNTPCMFDLVSGKPYYNQGTGSFTYGHTITPVEYLESTGTQYINTGIKLDNNSSVELDYQLTQAVQNRKGLFGGLDTGGSKRFGALLSPSNNQLEGGYGSGNEFYQLGLPDTNRHIIKQEKNLLYFDGSLAYTFNTAIFTQSFNAPLGNFNFTNYNPASAKYYRSRWWDNGTLVRSFIPVRDENSVGYMFDEVTGQLFGNAGSGSFGIGNDLPKPKVRFIQDVLPREYRPLKYLQSTGTQYIDTGIYPTQLTEVEYICAVIGSVANVDSHLFGSRLSASSEAFDLAYMNTAPNGLEKFRFVHGTTTTQETTTSVTASQLANPHTYYMSGTSFKVDGSEKMSFTTSSFTGSYSLWLFGVNNAGSLHNQVRAQRVYKCIIWDNGVLVRDLYPALRKLDNKPGMYDRITKQFFVNQGSGNDFNYE